MLREEWIKEEEEEVNILHWNVLLKRVFSIGIIKKIICHWKSFISKK